MLNISNNTEISSICTDSTNKQDTISVLLWNVEGLKGLIDIMPDINFFNDFNILVFTETFKTSNFDLPGFYSVHQHAKQALRGRPIGGIACYVSPKLGPILSHLSDDKDYLIVRLKRFTILCFYLNPKYNDIEIFTSVLSAYNIVKNENKPIIALGDFNCRIDRKSPKGESLIDTMSQINLVLCNPPNTKTYYAPNGSSTVDLLFIDPTSFINIICNVYDSTLSSSLRKHVPISYHFNQVTNNTPGYEAVEKSQITNKIDINKILSLFNLHNNKIKNLFDTGNTNEIYITLKNIIYESAEPKNNRKRNAKPWFDKQCYITRQYLLSLRHSISCQHDHFEYAEYRKEYRKLLFIKQEAFNAKQEKVLVEKAEETPYTYLSKDKVAVSQCPIPIYEWEPYFTQLFNVNSISATQSLSLTDLLAKYESKIPYTPISVFEIIKYSSKLKNNKAPGPDKITNEHIKSITPDLAQFYADFFNLCIETTSLPDEWKHSFIKVLYKGKGDILAPNNYRGLALSCTQYKLFDSIINARVFSALHHLIPDTQFGFMPGRSTIQAISLLHNKITSALNENKGTLYVVFIDFLKAFDCVNRSILLQKLIETNLLPKKLLMIIAKILDVNFISIHDGLLKSNKIAQSNGVLQGAVSSPLFFNLLTCKVKATMFGDSGPVDGDELDIYADDKALMSKNRERLQLLLDLLVKVITELGLSINSSKTKVMKFRKGGRLCKADIILCNGEKLEFVPNFKYLGVIFQQLGTTFTLHVKDRFKSAIAASYTISGLNLLSLETAIKLFHIKISPIASYGIEIIWSYLKVSDFQIIETVKSTYLKRVLSLSKYTKNRLVYKLANTDFFVSELKDKFKLPNTPQYDIFLLQCKNKDDSIVPEFYNTPAFINPVWKKSNFHQRHLYTRFAVHGFHHTICIVQKFHECDKNICKCKLCGERMADLYHFQICPLKPRMAHYADLISQL